MLSAKTIAMGENATQNPIGGMVGMKLAFHMVLGPGPVDFPGRPRLSIDTLYRMREIQKEKEAVGGL